MKLGLMIAALLGSTWFQISAATVVGLGALRVYKWHQQSVGAEAQRERNRKDVADETALSNRARIRAEELAQERYRSIFKEFGQLPILDAPGSPPGPAAPPSRVRQPAGGNRPINPFERTAVGK